MRYRALDDNGDYVLGAAAVFLSNTPEAVAQAVETRLKLWTQEWFLDSAEGTDYMGVILGKGPQDARDLEIKRRILETTGVAEITSYRSSVSADRRFVVNATITTLYGSTALSVTLR